MIEQEIKVLYARLAAEGAPSMEEAPIIRYNVQPDGTVGDVSVHLGVS